MFCYTILYSRFNGIQQASKEYREIKGILKNANN